MSNLNLSMKTCSCVHVAGLILVKTKLFFHTHEHMNIVNDSCQGKLVVVFKYFFFSFWKTFIVKRKLNKEMKKNNGFEVIKYN